MTTDRTENRGNIPLLPAPQWHFFQRVSRSWLILLFALIPLGVQAQEPPRLVVQTGHTDTVWSVRFSPDGKLLASASADGTVKLWDAATGQLLKTLQHAGPYSVCFSPDSRILAAASGDEKAVKLWDVATGQVIKTLEPKTRDGQAQVIFSVCFSPDGKTLASAGGEGTINLCDVATGQVTKALNGRDGIVNAVCYSPDGGTLASANRDGTTTLWAAASGQEIKKLIGHTDFVQSVRFSPDGRTLASASGDKTVKLWDVATGQVTRTLTRDKGLAPSVCFSPDGRMVAGAGEDHAVIVWDAASGQEIKTLTGHTAPVRSVVFSPDGKTLASASGDITFDSTSTDDNTVKLWDVATGQETRTLTGHTSSVYSQCFSPDGKTFATSSGGSVKLWNVATEQLTRTLNADTDYVLSVCFSPDGRILAAANEDKTVKLWDVATGQVTRTFTGQTGSALNVCFSPDGKRLASGSDNGTIKLWDVGTGQMLSILTEQPGWADPICFSPDSRILASASKDLRNNTVKLWRVTTGQLLKTYTGADGFYSVAFSPDGRILAAASEADVKLWKVATGELSKTLTEKGVRFICFSPDGGTLAGTCYDKINLWDVATGQLSKTLTGPTETVDSVSFSPNGKTLAGASDDGTGLLWNVSSGQLMTSLYGVGDNDWVAVSPEGRFDGSPEGLKSLHWVQDNKPTALESFFSQFYTPHLMARVIKGDTLPPPSVNLAQGIKPPPSVEITSPTAGQAIDGDTVQVTVEATDQGGGVQNVRLFQNGKLVADEQKKIVETTDSKRLTRTFTIALVPGQNVLKALASNTDQTDSNPAELTLELKAAQATADLYILAAGIENYKNPQFHLPYCDSDAQEFAEAIAKRGQTIFGAIHPVVLTDDQVTKAGIEAAFAKIQAQAKPTDVFVFYYSGHGDMPKAAPGEPEDFYLVCQDVLYLNGDNGIASKGLAAQRLRELSAQVKAQKQLLVLDACQSGGAISAFSKGLGEEKAIAQLAHSAGVMVLAASLEQQSAQVLDSLKHSIFTYALLQGLSGDADPPPGDGKVTVSKLNTYLNDELPLLTKKYGSEAQYPSSYAAGQDFPVGVH